MGWVELLGMEEDLMWRRERDGGREGKRDVGERERERDRQADRQKEIGKHENFVV